MQDITIRPLRDSEAIPWDLLLMADPSHRLIEQYIHQGKIYVAYMDTQLVGTYVLTSLAAGALELKNIAVDEQFQGKGIGKKLVFDAIEQAKKAGAKTLGVGTGNSSLSQLALYQKCGFRIVGVEKDFFTKHYAEEIVENGIRCVDMVRLRIKL